MIPLKRPLSRPEDGQITPDGCRASGVNATARRPWALSWLIYWIGCEVLLWAGNHPDTFLKQSVMLHTQAEDPVSTMLVILLLTAPF
ncbi:hypothetical protein Aple_016910 [Acrocarpospora pleiomorpha]|uniref:Uncharacterized protein n=1 Tax=Acrocarpospora pleiomorpha TaxID=90975 RepID=A0A5M3XDS3_9ACTN|nr:hypothetical protein Aple_016910 [Acrocarpospora pleiomorpha]